MEEKKNIIIDLDNSMYAHGFSSENQIHQTDLDKGMDIIKRQLAQIDNKEEKSISLNHIYHTIGVFGDRGSGKTSFLISLLEKCQNELQDVEVLRMIDPTLVEHKKPIVLCVISMINQLVEKKLRRKECSLTTNAYEVRKCWEKVLIDISIGVFAIDKVGKGYDDSLWQDEEYVMHTGLNKVNKANDFEENLRKMIQKALEILEKKAFILSFDDIDVDVEQGWNVLEALRRYLSDERIISIVSGNIKLYGMLVRNELCKNLTMQDRPTKNMMANELESQYMLKLLNPSNRINLLSLYNLLQYEGNTVKVKSNEKEEELGETYRNILMSFGIIDSASQKIFIEFLLSMSLRSQIHFIKDAWTKSNGDLPLNVFASRLHVAGIDMDVLKLNAQMTNIAILNYLRAKGNLPDCYLLLPTMLDKDTNSNFMALTLMECNHFSRDPFFLFDYMLRIGYIRNVILPLESPQKIANLCKYAGWDQMMSLKNSLGLTMAYVAGKKMGSLKEHISLFRMEEKAKKLTENALDRALKGEHNSFTRLMAMFPFLRISHSKDNESRSYYSVFAVLAVVGEILKCDSEENMATRINDLKLFRSYQMPQDEDYSGSESEIEKETFGVETNPDDIKTLANMMYQWKESYKSEFMPPYAIGRIMTRLYTSVMNVEKGSVGQMMNVMVAAFFNSCLIEEARVKTDSYEQSMINNNNPRKDTSVFMDNLGKAKVVDKLNFTKWMMRCPMLNCFLEDNIYNKIQTFMDDFVTMGKESFLVYELLNKIDSKGNISTTEKKPSFSGEKITGWKNTVRVMLLGGISKKEILEKIINEPNIDNAVKYIKATGLFSKVDKSSVEAFKNNYNQNELEAEHPNDDIVI